MLVVILLTLALFVRLHRARHKIRAQTITFSTRPEDIPLNIPGMLYTFCFEYEKSVDIAFPYVSRCKFINDQFILLHKLRVS